MVPLAVRNIESVVKTSQESKMHQTSQESKVRQTSQASEQVSQISNWTDGLSSTQLREIQLNDPDLGLIMHWLEHSYSPTGNELRLTSPAVRALWLTRDQLLFKNNILYYSWSEREGQRDCLIVPDKLKSKVLYYCHNAKESGHLGQTKTLERKILLVLHGKRQQFIC